MKHITDKLTAYTFALRDALERANAGNERPQITRHMAAAAEMYALLHMHQTNEAIAHIIRAEDRRYDLSALSGETGEKVATKWQEFINAVSVER